MYYRCMATDVQYLHECEELIVDLKEGQGLPLPLYGWTCPIYCTGIYVCTFIHLYVCMHLYTYIYLFYPYARTQEGIYLYTWAVSTYTFFCMDKDFGCLVFYIRSIFGSPLFIYVYTLSGYYTYNHLHILILSTMFIMT